MDDVLRLQPGLRALTDEQMVEANRFAQERIQAQLSIKPADEEAVETLLHEVYETAKLESARHIHWLDGPLELAAVLGGESHALAVDAGYRGRISHCVWDDLRLEADQISCMHDGDVLETIDYHIEKLGRRAEDQTAQFIVAPNDPYDAAGFDSRGWGSTRIPYWGMVLRPVWAQVREQVAEPIWRAIGEAVGQPVDRRIRDRLWSQADFSLWHGIRAYDAAPALAEVHYFNEYLAPNDAHALAHFNECVSGYWLGRAVALLVRKPVRLSTDGQGRLHDETRPCVEYRDGWGFWGWHGVRVPERVALAPAEELTRDDFLGESNIAVRRVIQERMGERFLWEMGLRFVNGGPRGVLYELDLPGDPDRVARYLYVRDPSTGREYYLRVSPQLMTAAEAAAWTFGLAVDEYAPRQET